MIIMIKRYFSILILTVIYSITIFLSFLTSFYHRPPKKHSNRVIINITFHNSNWFYSHIDPIVRSKFGEVILVCDEPIAELPGLHYSCPPRWVRTLTSRAGAKFIWTYLNGIKYQANIFIGYHIFPSAITALICSRLLGAKSIYQATSGQLELEGGGWHAENRLLVGLGYPSRLVEYLVFRVARCFDLVVVRGSKAREFLLESVGVQRPIETITGSVVIPTMPDHQTRNIDVIFVGRLTEYKRPDRFIQALSRVIHDVPTLNAVIVGDGPDRFALESLALELGLTSNIKFIGQRTDVQDIIKQAKVFVLTSRWEGVSIAMLEAMALGVVPIVSDVGDLRDFVQENLNGFILAPDDISGFANRITQLLKNDTLLKQMAINARKSVSERCEREILSKQWSKVLSNLDSI